jgi:hypothetical protein
LVTRRVYSQCLLSYWSHAQGDEGALRECLVEAEAEMEAEAAVKAKQDKKSMASYIESHEGKKK